MKATLHESFNALMHTPFPAFGDNDELADLVGELAEFDGHVAGVASTVLGGDGGAIPSSLAEHSGALRRRLAKMTDLSSEDLEIVRAVRNYLDAIDWVIQALAR